MRNNVVELHPKPAQIAQYVHLGHTGHRILGEVLAEGSSPITRVVADASHVREQHELLASFKHQRVQLILDSQAAELATAGGSNSTCRTKLPWAKESGFWYPNDLASRSATHAFCSAIADFAVACGADVILAPTHILEDGNGWLPVDIQLCEQLRVALDRAGGTLISIDYPLITKMRCLSQPHFREQLKEGLRHLPIENIWIRASGFGHNASCAALKKYIDATTDLGHLGKPIISDRVSGIIALTIGAMNAVGGFAHGIANSREQFDISYLTRESKSQKGGPRRWIYVATTDRYVDSRTYEQLIKIKGARSNLICKDSACCRNRPNQTIDNYIKHAIVQRSEQLKRINKLPEDNRVDALLRDLIAPTGRLCRRLLAIDGIRVNDNLNRACNQLEKQSRRMDSLHEMVATTIADSATYGTLRRPALRYSQLMPKVSGY